MLPASDDDGEHEHTDGYGERDEHHVVFGFLLARDVGVDLGCQGVVRLPVAVEERVATQEKALSLSRPGDGSLDGQRRRRPLAQPALLFDAQGYDLRDEIRPRREADRLGISCGDLRLARVVGGQERLIAAIQVSAQPGLLIEHAVVHLVDRIAPADQCVDRRLEVSKNRGKAGARSQEGSDDQNRYRDKGSRQPLREAPI